MTTFDEAIAPLTRNSFFANYWKQNFLHVRGKAGRFTDLFTWDDLSRVIEQHRLAPPRFRLFDGQDDRLVEPDRYLSVGIGNVPRVDPGKLVACLAGGATIIMDCIDEVAPKVRTLAHSFQDVLQVGNYVGMYAVWPPTQRGPRIHWDAEDLIVMQLYGRKHWRIYGPTREHPLHDDVELAPKPTGAPVWDGMLEDGDIFYIPRGWWHVALPADEPSMHLTVGNVPPHGMDFWQWAIRKLRHHVDVRCDLPARGDIGRHRAYMKQMRARAQELLSDSLLDEFLSEWHGNFRALPDLRLPVAPGDQNAPLMAKTKVILAAKHRLHFEREAGGTMANFRAGGIRWVCPMELIPALEILSDSKGIFFEELCTRLGNESSTENLRKSLLALAKVGVVLFETYRASYDRSENQ